MSNMFNETPQASAERVRQEVERWMDVAKTAGERTLEAIGLTPLAKSSQPAVDLWENSDAVFVWIDLPGVANDAVQLETTTHQLLVRVHRTPLDETGQKFHVRERPQASWERSLNLPTSVNPDQTAAQLRDGVLRVTLPKQIISQPRSVPINVVS